MKVFTVMKVYNVMNFFTSPLINKNDGSYVHLRTTIQLSSSTLNAGIKIIIYWQGQTTSLQKKKR